MIHSWGGMVICVLEIYNSKAVNHFHPPPWQHSVYSDGSSRGRGSTTPMLYFGFLLWQAPSLTQPVEGRLSFTLHFQATSHHWGKLGQELRSLEEKQRNRYRLLTCSLVHSCSASFLAQSRMTCPGMGLSTISWTLAHQPLVNVILTDNATVLSDETVLHLRFPGDFRLFPVDNKNYPAHLTFWRGVSSRYCHHQAVATVKRGQRTFPREANGSVSSPGIERAKAKIPSKSRSVNQWVSLGHLQEHGWRKGCWITEKFQPPSNISLG